MKSGEPRSRAEGAFGWLTPLTGLVGGSYVTLGLLALGVGLILVILITLSGFGGTTDQRPGQAAGGRPPRRGPRDAGTRRRRRRLPPGAAADQRGAGQPAGRPATAAAGSQGPGTAAKGVEAERRGHGRKSAPTTTPCWTAGTWPGPSCSGTRRPTRWNRRSWASTCRRRRGRRRWTGRPPLSPGRCARSGWRRPTDVGLTPPQFVVRRGSGTPWNAPSSSSNCSTSSTRPARSRSS